jgi:hypothetical protein
VDARAVAGAPSSIREAILKRNTEIEIKKTLASCDLYQIC